MIVSKIREGVYKVTDEKGVWMAMRIFASDSNKSYWCGWECDDENKTSDSNSWGVNFPTFKALKEFSNNY